MYARRAEQRKESWQLLRSPLVSPSILVHAVLARLFFGRNLSDLFRSQSKRIADGENDKIMEAIAGLLGSMQKVEGSMESFKIDMKGDANEVEGPIQEEMTEAFGKKVL